jgi:hypothetical protein
MNVNKITNCQHMQNSPKKELNAYDKKEIEIKEVDSIEISIESKILSRLKEIPEIRQEKVDAIKEILTEEKALSQKNLKLGLRKMMVLMFGNQDLSDDM